MRLFKEILPKEQQEIYNHLKQVTDLGFTLFGGTAIALQLGHRTSVDFDFFTSKNIANLKYIGNDAKVRENAQNSFNALIDSKDAKVSSSVSI